MMSTLIIKVAIVGAVMMVVASSFSSIMLVTAEDKEQQQDSSLTGKLGQWASSSLGDVSEKLADVVQQGKDVVGEAGGNLLPQSEEMKEYMARVKDSVPEKIDDSAVVGKTVLASAFGWTSENNNERGKDPHETVLHPREVLWLISKLNSCMADEKGDSNNNSGEGLTKLEKGFVLAVLSHQRLPHLIGGGHSPSEDSSRCIRLGVGCQVTFANFLRTYVVKACSGEGGSLEKIASEAAAALFLEEEEEEEAKAPGTSSSLPPSQVGERETRIADYEEVLGIEELNPMLTRAKDEIANLETRVQRQTKDIAEMEKDTMDPPTHDLSEEIHRLASAISSTIRSREWFWALINKWWIEALLLTLFSALFVWVMTPTLLLDRVNAEYRHKYTHASPPDGSLSSEEAFFNRHLRRARFAVVDLNTHQVFKARFKFVAALIPFIVLLCALVILCGAYPKLKDDAPEQDSWYSQYYKIGSSALTGALSMIVPTQIQEVWVGMQQLFDLLLKALILVVLGYIGLIRTLGTMIKNIVKAWNDLDVDTKEVADALQAVGTPQTTSRGKNEHRPAALSPIMNRDE